MSIHAPSRQRFQTLARIASSSIADPPWFAAPVDAEEDQDSVAVIFHLPGAHRQVRVEASDHSVTVWGGPRARQRAMRLCALSCSIDASRIETARSGDLLRVRAPKKSPAVASPDASSSTSST